MWKLWRFFQLFLTLATFTGNGEIQIRGTQAACWRQSVRYRCGRPLPDIPNPCSTGDQSMCSTAATARPNKPAQIGPWHSRNAVKVHLGIGARVEDAGGPLSLPLQTLLPPLLPPQTSLLLLLLQMPLLLLPLLLMPLLPQLPWTLWLGHKLGKLALALGARDKLGEATNGVQFQ